jgi:alpha-ketoglutarate-dependent taurine dioxygenase
MAVLTKPTITPTGATAGAIVTDVDLATMDDTTAQLIKEAFLEYGLLIFPGQHLTSEAQARFGLRFGKLEFSSDTEPKAVPISNRKADGSLVGEDEAIMKTLVGNEGWHTDSSYMGLAAKASILSAHVTPSRDGQTEWADMRAAYDALDAATQARIADLSAHHSLYYSQAKVGQVAEKGSAYGFIDGPEPLRPLVKVHPETGRKSLFIGRHAHAIPGMDEAESEKLLDELVDFACQPPRTYRHDWRPGDVVMWDNRCMLHRARPYDRSEPRVMMHVRVSGEPETETALNY